MNSVGTPSNGLVGYWSFDANDAHDDSGLGNTGTLIGGVLFGAGKALTGALFNDNDSYI